MRKLTRAERRAIDAWLAGIIVGFFPLLAHGAVFLASDGRTAWTAEILIVTVTNCGMAIVTCALKALAHDPSTGHVPGIGWPTGITAAFFLLGSILYGQVAAGNHKHIHVLSALIFLIFSLISSLYLELLLVEPVRAEAEPQVRRVG